MVQSTYEALYKGLMNINEDCCQPHGWHGLDGDRCIKHDTPTFPRSRLSSLLINMHEHEAWASYIISHHSNSTLQLTSDHEPVCVWCILFGINSRITIIHHAFLLIVRHSPSFEHWQTDISQTLTNGPLLAGETPQSGKSSTGCEAVSVSNYSSDLMKSWSYIKFRTKCFYFTVCLNKELMFKHPGYNNFHV